MIRAHVCWALGRLGYWLRPYDHVLDGRRWRWQSAAPCGRQVMATMPAEIRDAFTAAVAEHVTASGGQHRCERHGTHLGAVCPACRAESRR